MRTNKQQASSIADRCGLQALQSISMAEERQGEAHADGLAKLSSMQASAALQQAFALASTANAVNNNVAGYGGFAPAPTPAAPENGLAALQVKHLHRMWMNFGCPKQEDTLSFHSVGGPEVPCESLWGWVALADASSSVCLSNAWSFGTDCSAKPSRVSFWCRPSWQTVWSHPMQSQASLQHWQAPLRCRASSQLHQLP